MYQRVFMSVILTVMFSLAVFVQATAARPGSSQVVQQSPIISEKLAGLNVGVESQKPAGMTKAEYRALVIRGEALNQKYSNERSTTPIVSEKIGGLQLPTSSTTTQVASSGNEFDWSDAGIGAGFVFGTMVLGAGLVLTVRRRDFPIAH
jgi:hypothetical protein